jgi:glutathione S-transferase
MFTRSHFNEKARWALDWKGVEHRRRAHLPGPHALAIRRLSGQTATPVLALEDEVLAGSAAIIDFLERLHPDPPLYPEDPALRETALSLQREWDTEVGPAVRTVIFSEMIHEPAYLCATFADCKPWATRAAYRAAFPLARSLMARAHATDDPEAVKRATETTRRALDFVEQKVGPSGHLVGDTFSVADLCCAALLGPLLRDIPHPDMAKAEPIPERVETFLAQWSEHPAAHWARDQYSRHRPPSSAVRRAQPLAEAAARPARRPKKQPSPREIPLL